MTNTNNMFDSVAGAINDAIASLDNAFSPVYRSKGIAKDLAAADTVFRNAETALDQLPANIWTEETENGKMKGIEVAIPGKTKANVKISEAFVGDDRFLKILVESNEAENLDAATEETEKPAKVEPKREYSMRKIKGMTRLTFKVPVEECFDIDALKAKVENGLLTVTIPPVPPKKAPPAKEFVIE